MPNYVEESFGILTDDNLYLDCILVKAPNLPDEKLDSINVWVPRFPLTKTSLVTCARQEVSAYSPGGATGQLLFDLRGTGDSDGEARDKNYEVDLRSIRAWALERFGQIELTFLGQPAGTGQTGLLPIRPGVVVEHYRYPALEGEQAGKDSMPPVLYLSTYGRFGRVDDYLCRTLARVGYEVQGMDPLRYLLHASSKGRLKPADLWADLRSMQPLFQGRFIVVGQPVSAGLGLLWSSGAEQISGVISIGEAQAAFNPNHIFDNSNVHTFFLSRRLYRIAPRPAAFVLVERQVLGGRAEDLDVFYESCGQPRRLEKTAEVTPDLLLELLEWIRSSQE